MSTTTNYTYISMDPRINYAPADSWHNVSSPNATDGGAMYLIGDDVNGKANAFITFTFPEPATGLQYWAYQRPDGGNFSICFDCSPTSRIGAFIDAMNQSTLGTEPPRLLYSNYNLTYAVHNLTISNLFDTRATVNGGAGNNGGQLGGFAEMSLDRFVLFAPTVPPTSTSAVVSSSIATSIMTYSSASASPTSAATSHSTNTGAIAGEVIGGLAAVAVIALLFFCLKRRRPTRRISHQPQDMAETEDGKDSHSLTDVPTIVPFILGRSEERAAAPSDSSFRKRRPDESTGVQTPTRTEPSSSGSVPSRAVSGLYTATSSTTGLALKSRRDRETLLGTGPVAATPTTPASPAQFVHPPSPSIEPGLPRSREREGDAGWLAGELEEDTLPPDYDTATARRRELAQGTRSLIEDCISRSLAGNQL